MPLDISTSLRASRLAFNFLYFFQILLSIFKLIDLPYQWSFDYNF